MKKIILSIAILFLFLGCSGKKNKHPNTQCTNIYFPPKIENKVVTVKVIVKNKTFIQDDKMNIRNPDRGFYYTGLPLTTQKTYNIFQEAKEKGYKLVYSAIYLKDYIKKDILPNDVINTIHLNLDDAESLGIKLIIRLQYRDSIKSQDPDKEVILAHLNQLKPTLQNYENIISLVQAGSIGAWGEWHAFTGDYADTNPDYIKNRRDIVEKLVEIFPDKFIQIRTPMHKELLFGESGQYQYKSDEATITDDIAYTDDIRAKIGHHNDCFLASITDFGTYSSNNIRFWRNYVINDSEYTPTGGETCSDSIMFSNCSNAISELKRFQWSFINEDYHPDVIKRWKNEGCYQKIKENIGYKLIADTIALKQDKKLLTSTLKIKNLGYSSPYIESDIKFILSNQTHSYSLKETNIDLRKFQPNSSIIIKTSLTLDTVAKGKYCLYMQIGEGYSSIALANEGTWDEITQSNKLLCEISIK